MINQLFIIKFVGYILGATITIAIYEPKLLTLVSMWLALLFAGVFGALSESGGILYKPTKLDIFINGMSVIFYSIILYSLIYPIIEKGAQPFFTLWIMTFIISIISVGWFLIPIGGLVALCANKLNIFIERKKC